MMCLMNAESSPYFNLRHIETRSSSLIYHPDPLLKPPLTQAQSALTGCYSLVTVPINHTTTTTLVPCNIGDYYQVLSEHS